MLSLTGQGDSVAAGPGGLLAVAGKADSAQLWALDAPGGPRQLSSVTGHNGPVSELAISADGRRLATGGKDQTTRLWDIEDPTAPSLIGVLTGHSEVVAGVAFSPDGQIVATSSDDGSILLWDTDPERVAARICRPALPRLDEAEWRRQLLGVAFQPPC